MTPAQRGRTVEVATRFAYRVGEEVVVRLGDIEVFDLGAGGRTDGAGLPPWTIAIVTACRILGGEPHYAVRFEHGEARCIAVVPEGAIDGVA